MGIKTVWLKNKKDREHNRTKENQEETNSQFTYLHTSILGKGAWNKRGTPKKSLQCSNDCSLVSITVAFPKMLEDSTRIAKHYIVD